MELNKIYNEDCLRLLKRIPDNSIDLIVTDPPFDFGGDDAIKGKDEKYLDWCERWIKECYRILKFDKFFYLIPADKDWQALQTIGAKYFYVINYENKTALKFLKGLPREFEHQTSYPLIDKIIKENTKKEDIILDPFMGIGTTAVSSQSNNRKFIGCEINKDRFDKINKNIKRYGNI